ncbi:hypothetical protein CAEBREN_08279 [Caenorhabditis brenneri]|uniref:Uncharacterized protein n=1 Tax=Caenorhabditis brenneri TaxID=135651 RepID=G0PKV6_CAEBE|nr:hypothetical protein CAEBREN_08279 [Caenorhabditis brenneri]
MKVNRKRCDQLSLSEIVIHEI